MAVESRPGFAVGEATVAAAGTPVQLPDIKVGQACELVIKAKKTNQGAIKVGQSSSEALAGKFNMEPSEAVKLRVSNANKAWIDAEISGDKVEIIAEQ
jgi:hypothetical protein